MRYHQKTWQFFHSQKNNQKWKPAGPISKHFHVPHAILCWYLCDVPLLNRKFFESSEGMGSGPVCLCISSVAFASGGVALQPRARVASTELKVGLQILIASDSSLSSLVDQCSSALFIRNINVARIPTGSATTHQPSQGKKDFFLTLKKILFGSSICFSFRCK